MPQRMPGTLVAIVLFGMVLSVVAVPERTSAGAVVRTDETFDAANWFEGWDGWSPGPLNNAALTPSVDGTALTVTIPEGRHHGSRFELPLADGSGITPDEIYFRYDVALSENWGGDGTGKLPGPAGLYSTTARGGFPSTEDSPGWSARIGFAPGTEPGTSRLSYYVYHLDQPSRYGQTMSFGERGIIQNGDWYCVEGRVRMNTPGARDGVLEAWIDGMQVMDRRDLAFRRQSERYIGISSFWFNVYYGGTSPSPTEKTATFDNVTVGPQRIGCGDAIGQVVPADVTGDGRTDLLTLATCDGTPCWNIDEGHPVNPSRLPDTAPASALTWQTQRLGVVAGDFDGDGHDDVASWGRCDDSIGCWSVQRGTQDGLAAPGSWGVATEANLADPRLGLAAGDFDGDGRSDVVYLTPCGADACWTVQRSLDGQFADPASWGAGAFFADDTGQFGLLTGDTDGDGRDDLIYSGLCGDPAVACWRVQLSTGTSFARGTTWALRTDASPVLSDFGVTMADVNGDALQDLVYLSECELTRCWRALVSDGSSFVNRYWGSASDSVEAATGQPTTSGDLDGDHVDDLAVRTDCGRERCWQVLLSSRSGFVTIGTELAVDDETPLPPLSDSFRAFRRAGVQ
jgi:hypothetical protein